MTAPRTQWEELYERVYDDIVSLRIKPGEKISEAKLAIRYGVGRAPTRNVIQKLRAEGFVVVKPQVGTVVLPISEQKARDILQIRLLLEPFAAEMAASHVTDADIADLEKQFARLGPLAIGSEERADVLSAVDVELHQLIWQRCGNTEILPIFNTHVQAMRRIRLASRGLKAERMTPSEEEMNVIFDALRRRDPVAAREAMRVHIENIVRAMQL